MLKLTKPFCVTFDMSANWFLLSTYWKEGRVAFNIDNALIRNGENLELFLLWIRPEINLALSKESFWHLCDDT